MTTAKTINELADDIESITDSGHVWSLRLDNVTSDQRRLLLDTHGRVLGLLRHRGHRVRAGVVHDDHGIEHITIRIITGPEWENAPS